MDLNDIDYYLEPVIVDGYKQFAEEDGQRGKMQKSLLFISSEDEVEIDSFKNFRR